MTEEPLPSVWARRPKEQQPGLTTEQIVRAALELLDEEGMEQLSMRKLGARLGAGATSLYRHVKNKDELIELVVDVVYGEVEVPDVVGRDWRPAAEKTAHSVRAMILRHPWVGPVLGQAGLGPNVMRLSEKMLRVLIAAGFDAVEADQAMNAMLSYVIGIAVSETAYLAMVKRSGSVEKHLAVLLQHAIWERTGEFPMIRAGFDAMKDRNPKKVRDENFDYGLQRVLDGLAARAATVRFGQ
ncbi:TetR/AcrR family transcriptional regulator [Actinophytocola sp.]|uniref:TetR/AcrR family transcriptional regulator n=1 Tax=Actinophytocola sp. TaxID=1872138 RepID=UPI002ED0D4F9